MSAVLKKNGHKTDLLFDPSADQFGIKAFNPITRFNFKIIDRKIEYFKPDLVAFSVYTNAVPWVESIATYIKNKYSIKIVLGGPHATIVPEFMIRKDYVDFILIGESDYAFLQLVNHIEAGEDLEDVPNLVYKDEGVIKTNPVSPLIENLDSLPFPDKDLFYNYGAFSDRYYIITSRGCPFDCTYCINHQLHQIYCNDIKVRRRSVQNVINELIWAKHRYHIKSIYFLDDNFFINQKWLQEFVPEYQKNNINLPTKFLSHPQSITTEKLRLAKALHCFSIEMGVESGSQTIRESVLDRYMSNRKIISSARLIKSFGIKLNSLNMINIPKETPKDMIKTLVLNQQIRPDGLQITSLYPFPKTKVQLIAAEEGLIDAKMIEEINNGISNFRSNSILNHPYKELGERIRVYAPIFNKLPRVFMKYLFYLPSIRILNVISILFNTNFTNVLFKIKEFLIMIFKTRAAYAMLMNLTKK